MPHENKPGFTEKLKRKAQDLAKNIRRDTDEEIERYGPTDEGEAGARERLGHGKELSRERSEESGVESERDMGQGGWKTNLRSMEPKRSGRESTISRGERERGHD
jgi:hypothetical protein